MIKVPRLIKRPKRGVGRSALDGMSEPDIAEALLCSPEQGLKGFVRWCRRHVRVEDKEHGGDCPLELWPGQARVAVDLVKGRWIIGLKGRQLGFTWLVIAFILWRCVYRRSFLVVIINQEKQYAYDNIRRLRFIYDRLPPWSQPTITKDTESRLYFGERTEIRSLVGGENAARSFTGDLAFFDEASRVPDLGDTLAAVSPALTRSVCRENDGQIILATSSKGPTGEYADLWDRTFGVQGELLDEDGIGPTRFKPVFVAFNERPGRSEEWYQERKRELDAISRVKVLQEYPRTIEEAFEHAAGRVYPLFTRERNIGVLDPIPDYAERMRAIDWGETKSAYVVIWIAYVEGPPGLLIHPDCRHTIREFLSYRLDEDTGRPAKGNDHTCDALRYAVTYHNMTGLVYVYREIYRLDSVARGWNPMTEIEEIHELSGWKRTGITDRKPFRPGLEGERFDLVAVADRSLGKMIKMFSTYGIPCQPHRRIRGKRTADGQSLDKPHEEKVEGIRAVAALIDGTRDIDHYYHVTRREQALRIYREAQKGPDATSSLQDRQLLQLAKEILGHR
ncbi:MAG: hypothetical protein IID41_02655 [Planctomycetes bacterium]|nr:hypothetical protein [Planctomycetota bacterium]